jgi:hypothetical protein
MRHMIWLLLTGLLFSPLTSAREVAGIDFPETMQLAAGAPPLVLNGAGIRKKFFFKIYVAGLYLPSRQTSTEAILDMPGPKRVHMHFLYKEVEGDKLVTGWQEGFENNFDNASLAQLAPRLAKFNQLFHTMHRGEVIDLDYQPEEGTQVLFNGELQGVIKGDDFYAALLKVWLGQQPADADLKTALLKGAAE